MRMRKVVMEPSLKKTLAQLQPGDAVRCGKHWKTGNIRSMASAMGLSITQRRDESGITVMRQIDRIPRSKIEWPSEDK